MMKNKLLIPLFLLALAGCSQPQDNSRERLFSDGWKFVRDSIPGAEAPDFDDSQWISVDLPHDYSLMPLPGGDTDDQVGPFSKLSPSGTQTGHVMGGTGWYRKTFTTSSADKDKRFTLVFDGAYMETDVWVNGQKVGDNKYGYSPFAFDITSALNGPGKKNVVSVKVDNKGRNSRWYSGSGLYRDVKLIVTEPVHVDLWGAQITTPIVTKGSASVDVRLTLCNDLTDKTDSEVGITIVDKNGAEVAKAVCEASVDALSKTVVEKQIEVANPDLWSTDEPNLYRAEITLTAGGKVVDTYSQTFGIRTIEYSSEKGFLLNGEPLLMKGGCMHHDNGFLGAAAIKAAEYHRVKLMKDNGFNAIRCSHNPPSEHFLNACDELGIVVIDEFVDMWNHYKNTHDYARFFNERWEGDLTRMMLRDRNHPSVVIWSIGNEIPKASVEEAVETAKMLKSKVYELDGTRPVSESIPHFLMQFFGGWEYSNPFFEVLDIGGYNYMDIHYLEDHKLYPERVMCATETYSTNAYDSWKYVENLPYVIGDFVWTALDYIGEVWVGKAEYVEGDKDWVVYNHQNMAGVLKGVKPEQFFDAVNDMHTSPTWPKYISWCGDIDIIGEKKSQGRYRSVLWDESVIELHVHEPYPAGMCERLSAWGWPQEYDSWNWEGNEGTPLKVRALTKAQQVRLELNGEIVGEKTLTEADKYITEFSVPYQPGTLTAIAINDGQEIGRKVLTTTGKAQTVQLTVDRSQLNACRGDLAFIRIDAVDENGNTVQTEDHTVEITVSGDGELAASGNASIDDMGSVNRTTVRLYRGQAQAIIRPFAKAGTITVNISSEGLADGNLKIAVK